MEIYIPICEVGELEVWKEFTERDNGERLEHLFSKIFTQIEASINGMPRRSAIGGRRRSSKSRR